MTEPSRMVSSRRWPQDSSMEGHKRSRCQSEVPKAKKLCTRAWFASHEDGWETRTSLGELSPDLFCNILGFLGATSTSLVSLSLVNKRFRSTMTTIGDAMLPRALTHFRKPLRPKSAIESSTSLFIRHATICERVLSDLAHLRSVLGKAPDTIRGNEVREALKMAIDLLEVVPALSAPLEKQILATCGKCGGKVFKHSKSVLATQKLRMDTSLIREYEERLATSRGIMQTVVHRELQLSKKISSVIQNQLGTKRLEKAGWC
jgi:hypothetical protein